MTNNHLMTNKENLKLTPLGKLKLFMVIELIVKSNSLKYYRPIERGLIIKINQSCEK